MAKTLTLRQRKLLLSQIAADGSERTSERLKAIDLLNRLDGAYTPAEAAASGSCCIIDDVADVGNSDWNIHKYPIHSTNT